MTDTSYAERKAALRAALGTGVKTGLIGGIVVVSIALQGMIQTFSTRDVVSGILSMSQSLLLIAFFATAYLAVSRTHTTYPLLLLGIGALSGLVSGLLLVALIWLGSIVNLGAVFVNATQQLYDLLTFKQGSAIGSLIQLAFAMGAGISAALVYILPTRIRRPLITSLVAIIALGFFQDWLIRTVSNTPQTVRGALVKITRSVYASNGLSPTGTLILFVLIVGLTFLWVEKGAALRSNINRLPPPGRRAYQLTINALLILLLLLLPVLLGIENSEILDNVVMFLIMGLGLNIVVGFAGLLDLGYVAFFAIGAYTVGVLTSPELGHLPILHSWWIALPFGLIAAILAGVLLGIPVLKMRGDYLAIVTLGFGEIIRLLVGSDLLKPFLGGAQGTRYIARPDIGPVQFGLHKFTLPLLGQIQFQIQQEFYYIFLAGCLLAILIAMRLKSSRLGRAWMAMREDEVVAQAMGIELVANKLLAFGIGAFFGGLSGAIFASKLGSIFPTSFNFLISINVLSVIIVGGMGSIPGVIVGALALVAIPELTREFAEYRYLLYGIALVAMMLMRPEGLWPEARRRLELHEAEEQAPVLIPQPVIEVESSGDGS
jgi:branched-chain amino acid transport system permease protein